MNVIVYIMSHCRKSKLIIPDGFSQLCGCIDADCWVRIIKLSDNKI